MKMCPYCTKEIREDAVKCRHCGGWFTDDAEIKQKRLDEDERLEKMLQNKKDKSTGDIGEQTQYFHVPTQKLVILCLLTFGIYEIYWFYKNWQSVKVQERKKISPFWRAIFAVFFCYSLFKRIILSAAKKGYEAKVSHGVLAVIYITITMLYRLPDPYWIVSSLTFIPLIYVSHAIYFNNIQLNPEFVESSKLNAKEILFCVFGILLWFGVIFDFLSPLNPHVQ